MAQTTAPSASLCFGAPIIQFWCLDDHKKYGIVGYFPLRFLDVARNLFNGDDCPLETVILRSVASALTIEEEPRLAQLFSDGHKRVLDDTVGIQGFLNNVRHHPAAGPYNVDLVVPGSSGYVLAHQGPPLRWSNSTKAFPALPLHPSRGSLQATMKADMIRRNNGHDTCTLTEYKWVTEAAHLVPVRDEETWARITGLNGEPLLRAMYSADAAVFLLGGLHTAFDRLYSAFLPVPGGIVRHKERGVKEYCGNHMYLTFCVLGPWTDNKGGEVHASVAAPRHFHGRTVFLQTKPEYAQYQARQAFIHHFGHH